MLLRPRVLVHMPAPRMPTWTVPGTTSYLVYFLDPPVDAIKGPAVCDVIDQDHTLGERHQTYLTGQRRAQGRRWPVCRPLRPRPLDSF